MSCVVLGTPAMWRTGIRSENAPAWPFRAESSPTPNLCIKVSDHTYALKEGHIRSEQNAETLLFDARITISSIRSV